MLATSFASDTPLHTTRAIREGGLAQAWFYWNGIISGVVVAFVFAKLWRRAGVVTDNELIELRYSGRAAAVLRGGLALFKSLFLEILTMAWITLGMVKIVKTIMGLPEELQLGAMGAVRSEVIVVAVLLVVTIVFSVASGFWGVVATDLAEFSIAMGGAIVLAVVAMNKVGGASGLREGLKQHAPMGERTLDFLPDLSASGMSMLAFGVYLGAQWWARNEVDGSGQRAQRLLACKDERHAIAAGIWSLAVTWLIRSWPWYLTALASLVLYPHASDHESVYPQMVADLMPVGLKGLMVASFFAAFMGTLEAHYNLTASYVVNDVYKRFIAKDEDEAHYVRISRFSTLGIALLAAVAALLLPSVLGAFRFKMELVAGLGLIYILRWFWWRVTAMTEIVALVVSVVSALVLNVTMTGPPEQGAHYSALRLLLVVGISAVVSLAATFIGRPEPESKLLEFYRRVRPPKLFWGPIARLAPEVGPSGLGGDTLLQALLAIVFVFAGMVGIGKLILGEPVFGITAIACGAVAGAVMLRWLFGPRNAAADR
jgi:Na+/proline symporter